MYKNTFRQYMASLFAVLVISFGAFAPVVSAETISNEDVTEQKRVVMLELVDTLEAQLKLLQMLYIQKLEGQVAFLQTLVDTQSS